MSTPSSSPETSAPAVKTLRLIKGIIADSSGHTDFSGSAEEAVALIQENVEKHNKWVFIDNEPVFPQGPADFQIIRDRLETQGGEFTVTAKLQGGEAIKVEFVKTGVKSALGGRRSNPQLAVTYDGERDSCKVIVSGRDTILEALRGKRDEIVTAVRAALN